MDTSIADELLDPTSPLHEETADMTSRLAEVYQVHVLLDSPSGVRPELAGVEPLAVLPYSTAGGRSSLARALQCQLHVEMALVSPNEQVTLFDRRIASSADADEELKQYFGRLEQLAAAVDALAFVVVPDNTAEGDTERDVVSHDRLIAAWHEHPIARRTNVRLVDYSGERDAWSQATDVLLALRSAWS